MDVADADAIRQAVETAEARMGGIDVLVNNAGYGLVAAIEEASLEEMRAQFDVNLFGPLAVIQAVLPGMRARRSGRILNVTSVSGLAAWGGTGIYCASKYALTGATQALAQEVAEFGIKVTNVAPGGMRTDYSGRSLVLSERTIDDYEGAGHFPRRVLREHLGQEAGDPVKTAAAILEIAKTESPPMHLLLGADAVHYATRAAAQFQTDLSDWLSLTLSTAAAPAISRGCDASAPRLSLSLASFHAGALRRLEAAHLRRDFFHEDPHRTRALLGRGPVLARGDQEHAKAAAAVVEGFELHRDVVGIADHIEARAHEVVDRPAVVGHVQAVHALQHVEEAALCLHADLVGDGLAHVLDRLAAGVGDIDRPGHTAVLQRVSLPGQAAHGGRRARSACGSWSRSR